MLLDTETTFAFIEESDFTIEEINDAEEGGDDVDQEYDVVSKADLDQAKKSTASLVSSVEAEMKEIQQLLDFIKVGSSTVEDKARLSSLCKKLSATKSAIQTTKATETSVKEKYATSMEGKRLSKKKHIQNVAEQVAAAESVDIAFIIDATGSMGPHIEAVKNSILNIVTSIKATNSELNLRMAIVAYRDIGDATPFEVMDFCKDIAGFLKFLQGIKPEGGGGLPLGDDCAEDLAGGLRHANQLAWQHPTRVAYIVADAPCHGSEFNGGMGDNYPGGTPGIDVTQELRTLMEKSDENGSMSVYFGRITYATDVMISRFNAHKIALGVIDFSDSSSIKKAVTSSVRTSIFKTMTNSGIGPRDGMICSSGIGQKRGRRKHAILKPYTIVPRHPVRTEWTPTTTVKVYRNTRIKSMNDLQAPLGYGMLFCTPASSAQAQTDATRVSTMHMCRAGAPFAEGAMRIAFHAQLAQKKSELELTKSGMVLKAFKHHGKGINDRRQYLKQMEVSTIAHFLAREYNKSAFRPAHCAPIHVLQACVVEEEASINEKDGSRRFCAEELLPSGGTTFTKYSNNTGYWDQDGLDESLLRFTKFTYEATHAYLMVTDLQGVKKDGKFILTDPVILCNDVLRFGSTNLGEKFMEKCIGSTCSLMRENGWV